MRYPVDIVLFGELSVCDFISDLHNLKSHPQLPRLGESMWYDHWANYLLNNLKQNTLEFFYFNKEEFLPKIEAVLSKVERELLCDLKTQSINLIHFLLYAFIGPINDLHGN